MEIMHADSSDVLGENTALDCCSMIMIQAKDKPFSMGSELFVEGPRYFERVKVA
jgi:hypothetical protein